MALTSPRAGRSRGSPARHRIHCEWRASHAPLPCSAGPAGRCHGTATRAIPPQREDPARHFEGISRGISKDFSLPNDFQMLISKGSCGALREAFGLRGKHLRRLLGLVRSTSRQVKAAHIMKNITSYTVDSVDSVDSVDV